MKLPFRSLRQFLAAFVYAIVLPGLLFGIFQTWLLAQHVPPAWPWGLLALGIGGVLGVTAVLARNFSRQLRLATDCLIAVARDPLGQAEGAPGRNPIAEFEKVARMLRATAIERRELAATEAKLAEEQAQFRQLCERLPQLVWTCTPSGSCDYLSPQWVAYTGIPAAVQLGSGWLNQVHPDERLSIQGAWYAAKERLASFDTEFRLRRHDGVYRWFRIRAVALLCEDGQVRQWFGTCTDIEDLKATELAIRRSEERSRLALSVVRMNVFEHDLLSDRVERSAPSNLDLGLPQGYLGTDFMARVHPEDRIGLLAARQAMTPATPTYGYVYRYWFASGTYRWLADQAQGQFDPEGRLVQILGTRRDVTEFKLSEQSLQRRAERQAMLLKISSALLAMENEPPVLAGYIFDTLKESLEIDLFFNYRFDAAQKNLHLVAGFGIPAAHWEAAQNYPLAESFCATAAATGWKSLVLDRERLVQDPRGINLLAMGARVYICLPLFTRDGLMLGSLCLASTQRDHFTSGEHDFLQTVAYQLALAWERFQAENEIQRLNEDLERQVAQRTAEFEASNKELKAFTYAASHDLKSPLTRISSFSALLEKKYREHLEGDGLLFLDFIRSNALRMSSLIDDMLAHAQIEQQVTQLQAIDLGGAVQALLNERKTQIAEGGAQVRVDLPQMWVCADPVAFSQVLRNLFDNALKYAAQARPPIIVIGGENHGGHCRFWIQDNGVGFDPAHHDRIFELFRRLHTYDEFPGSGVGLALVKKAMERMGGRVWAESQLGQGATFFLEIGAP